MNINIGVRLFVAWVGAAQAQFSTHRTFSLVHRRVEVSIKCTTVKVPTVSEARNLTG